MIRLDQALVERGLCESREKAKRAILAGQVRINAQPARKPSDSVKPEDELHLDAGEKYVSRGGHKLEHALNHFQLDVNGLIALDLGASTGGFTDCLLQRGAAKVFSVDVGRGQLAWKLRKDKRVVVMEKTNARHLTLEHFEEHGQKHSTFNIQHRTSKSAPTKPRPSVLGVECSMLNVSSEPPADIITIDCSFISLKKILPAAAPLLKAGGKIIALIKPQFEAGKAEADKGRGVITDAAIHERVIRELRDFVSAQAGPVRCGGGSLEELPGALSHGAGLCWRDVVESPLLGPAGNKEFLVLIEKTC
jgi:23S rRNA (cytidine1920-2'-O)/16S rRNA (cytidine1409-2'-O)-methyltransferase